jgi:hypothetical protein
LSSASLSPWTSVNCIPSHPHCIAEGVNFKHIASLVRAVDATATASGGQTGTTEVQRLESLGASVVDRLERWFVMQAPTRQRFCVVRVQRPGYPKNANRWD